MAGEEIGKIRPVSPARIVLIPKSDLTRANSLRYIIIAAYFGRRSKSKKFQKRAGVCENGVGCAEVRRQFARRFG